MESKALQALLLDLDGTLVDTEAAAIRVFSDYLMKREVAEERARALSAEVVGRTWALGIQEVERLSGIRFVDRRQTERELLAGYRKILESEGVKEIPGARAILPRLSQHFQLVVVSGSPRAEIALCLESLGASSLIQFYLGAEDYPQSKPAPDSYLLALARLGLPGSSTLVFEDSHAGISAALAAQLKVVAIESAHLHTPEAEAPARRAHHRVRDWSQVSIEQIQQWSGSS